MKLLIKNRCNNLVRRLINKRIRIIIDDFDGYGVVVSVKSGWATIKVER